jgi:HSP20 family protein
MAVEETKAAAMEAPKSKPHEGPGRTTDVPRTSAPPPTSPINAFAIMRRFAREMGHLFEEFGLESGLHLPRFLSRGRELLRREAGFVPAEWSPRVDVVEGKGQFVVRADLPGLNKDDVKVEINHDVITIQGERKQEKKEEREGYCSSECSYGSFHRAIPLPEGADASKAIAEFRKGGPRGHRASARAPGAEGPTAGGPRGEVAHWTLRAGTACVRMDHTAPPRSVRPLPSWENVQDYHLFD